MEKSKVAERTVSTVFLVVILMGLCWFGRQVYAHEKEMDLRRECDALQSKHSVLTGLEMGHISAETIEGKCYIRELPRFVRDPEPHETKAVHIEPADIEKAWARQHEAK